MSSSLGQLTLVRMFEGVLSYEPGAIRSASLPTLIAVHAASKSLGSSGSFDLSTCFGACRKREKKFETSISISQRTVKGGELLSVYHDEL